MTHRASQDWVELKSNEGNVTEILLTDNCTGVAQGWEVLNESEHHASLVLGAQDHV